MPIRIPDALPAAAQLESENIFVMTEYRALHQDIRPLRVLILNLMPTKIATETQIMRKLSNTPLQVEVDLLRTKTHEATHVSAGHLETFYRTFDDIRDIHYDGLIITGAPVEHEVPEEYLADETFAAILEEAEKYIGYPYVWGGYKPSTSFDCSGFVSYVYNQCGWDFGRLGAQGLYNISTRTSSPKPGDLVFFTGTYDTQGISHVGIYVGDGWMLHCGDPISYANLNTSYWQSHFYAYGKLF